MGAGRFHAVSQVGRFARILVREDPEVPELVAASLRAVGVQPLIGHQAWHAAVNALFGRVRKFRCDYRVIPWATFTDPEVARVGLSESHAREQGTATTLPLGAQALDHTHGAWSALLRKPVRLLRVGQATQVHCAGFTADRSALKACLDSLSAVPPECERIRSGMVDIAFADDDGARNIAR
jgi:hypothetical protein